MLPNIKADSNLLQLNLCICLMPIFTSDISILKHNHKQKHNNLQQVKTNIDISIRLILMLLLTCLVFMSGPFSLDIGAISILPLMLVSLFMLNERFVIVISFLNTQNSSN